jgi:hypothetical protein
MRLFRVNGAFTLQSGWLFCIFMILAFKREDLFRSQKQISTTQQNRLVHAFESMRVCNRKTCKVAKNQAPIFKKKELLLL